MKLIPRLAEVLAQLTDPRGGELELSCNFVGRISKRQGLGDAAIADGLHFQPLRKVQSEGDLLGYGRVWVFSDRIEPIS